MKDGQSEIYYITGESRALVESSPLIEAFRKKDYEVLFLTDPVDEFVVDNLPEFDGKKLKSVARGEVDLDEGDSEGGSDRKQQEQHFRDLFDLIGKHLEDSVKRVRLSSRLTESPACLTVDEHDMTPQMKG